MVKKVRNGESGFNEANELVQYMVDEFDWLKANKTAKMKNKKKPFNLRNYFESYYKLATKINKTSVLSPRDKAYILRAFEFLKKLDRYFAPNVSVAKYASLIQEIKTNTNKVRIKPKLITVRPNQKKKGQ